MTDCKQRTEDATCYDAYIGKMRKTEYPMLKDALYLDHAGTTLYSKTQLERFHAEMLSSIYGNPHSASPSSQKSTLQIESVRHQVLRLFDADPEVFDLVFTANTTAAIKLVAEAFREQEEGFWYGYHVDSHTSVVGVREVAEVHRCFDSDEEVETWLCKNETSARVRLFAYPAQSNMNGRKLPLRWAQECRAHGTYSLLDAAAYTATSALRLSVPDSAPDFTALSFTKMFGFPDLGALIVRKECAPVFRRRKYFGGGTVEMVVCVEEQWHASKTATLHEQLEDGTLPMHSIIALKAAMQTHTELYGSLDRVMTHTTGLAAKLYDQLVALRHANGRHVCQVYKHKETAYGDPGTQGPTIAFNLQDGKGNWVSNSEVEKLAAVQNIHLRVGGLCNPGGVAQGLGLAPWEMHANFSSGFRCGSENDVMNGKPTGMIRVSLGAMSTRRDVARFLEFIVEFFVDSKPTASAPLYSSPSTIGPHAGFYVESLAVYPIKSCSAWQVPEGTSWDIRREGLAWDREWCVVSQSTGAALSQKAHPRMALIRPQLDFKSGVLRITHAGSSEEISVPLSKDPRQYSSSIKLRSSSICGDDVETRVYTSSQIARFLTSAVGVACTLARFPSPTLSSSSARHTKSHLRPASGCTTSANMTRVPSLRQPLLFSNESPILTISRSSLNRLNENIKTAHVRGKAAHHSVFRANIVLAELPLLSPPGKERPYIEDNWTGMKIYPDARPATDDEHNQVRADDDHSVVFDILGGCRRCQMVCIDQQTGEKHTEPFVTLAKTRRKEDGRGVMFGVHTALAACQDHSGARDVKDGAGANASIARIRVGDLVEAW